MHDARPNVGGVVARALAGCALAIASLPCVAAPIASERDVGRRKLEGVPSEEAPRQEPVDQRSLLMTSRRVDHEARGLVDDDDLVVDEEHLELDARVGQGGRGLTRRGSDDDPLAFTQAGARVAHGAFHGDPAVLDPALDLGARRRQRRPRGSGRRARRRGRGRRRASRRRRVARTPRPDASPELGLDVPLGLDEDVDQRAIVEVARVELG